MHVVAYMCDEHIDVQPAKNQLLHSNRFSQKVSEKEAEEQICCISKCHAKPTRKRDVMLSLGV